MSTENDGDGAGCLLIIIIILVGIAALTDNNKSAEQTCAAQPAGYENAFCKALAEKYRGKP